MTRKHLHWPNNPAKSSSLGYTCSNDHQDENRRTVNRLCADHGY